jgi:hypothetical protein
MLSRNLLVARSVGSAGRPGGDPPPSGDGEVVFFSDWRTQTPGGSQAVILDTDKWSLIGGINTDTQIIARPNTDWPMANVLRVAFADSFNSGALILNAEADPPLTEYVTGLARNYRWYYANREPDNLEDADQHSVQDGGSVGNQNWGFYTFSKSAANGGGFTSIGAGQYAIYIGIDGGRYYLATGHTPDLSGHAIPLTKDVPYRIEVQVLRINETQCRIHAAVYLAETEELLYDDADFKLSGGSPTTLATATHSFNNLPMSDIWQCGNNGIGGTVSWPIAHGDEAGFICVEGLAEGEFIGAYGVNYDVEVLP